jgi:hypothetical protein
MAKNLSPELRNYFSALGKKEGKKEARHERQI